MKQCNQTIKSTCGDLKNYATCTYFEGALGENSNLEENNCNTIEETTEDLYTQVDTIFSNIDLTALGNGCLTYADKKPKTIILKLEQEVCLLKAKVLELETTELCSRDITQCGINLTGLVDPCDAPINTLGQLLQFLVDNVTP